MASSSPNIWYRWRPSTPHVASVRGQIALYRGTSRATLSAVEIMTSQDSSFAYASAAYVIVDPAEEYYIEVTGASDGDAPFQWIQLPRLESFTDGFDDSTL